MRDTDIVIMSFSKRELRIITLALFNFQHSSCNIIVYELVLEIRHRITKLIED